MSIHSLTIGIITSRPDPKIPWIMDSLAAQWGDNRVPVVMVVDSFAPRDLGCRVDLHMEPKPSLWNGKHRVTSEDWWAASSYRNTILCHAQTEWVWFLDDRCVVTPKSIDAVRDAMLGNYAVFGTYQKWHHMEYEDGKATGEKVAEDHRFLEWVKHVEPWVHLDDWTVDPNKLAMPCPPSWCYGCSIALPLQWALDIGGFEEACDGLSAEDTAFGAMLANNGREMRFDARMGVVQDRTPGQTGAPMRREDKGISPNDKSHRSVELFHSAKNTSNRHLLLQSRQAALEGRPWPLVFGGREDWHDGEPINENYMKR